MSLDSYDHILDFLYESLDFFQGRPSSAAQLNEMRPKKGLIKVGSIIFDIPQIVISRLCVSQIADKKTDK